jgi:hypothetical protein
MSPTTGSQGQASGGGSQGPPGNNGSGSGGGSGNSGESPSFASPTKNMMIKPKAAARSSGRKRQIQFDKSTDDSVKEGQKITLHRIAPEDTDSTCVVIQLGGQAEAVTARCFYKRNDEIWAKEFMESVDFIPQVIKMFKNGEVYNNTKGYQYRGFTWPIDREDNKDKIVNDVKTVLIPQVIHLLQRDGKDKEHFPSAEDIDLHEYTHYSQVMDGDSLQWTLYHMVCKPLSKSFATWLRDDQKHVYSLYREGEVPLQFIQKHSLNALHLRTRDVARLAAVDVTTDNVNA